MRLLKQTSACTRGLDILATGMLVLGAITLFVAYMLGSNGSNGGDKNDDDKKCSRLY